MLDLGRSFCLVRTGCYGLGNGGEAKRRPALRFQSQGGFREMLKEWKLLSNEEAEARWVTWRAANQTPRAIADVTESPKMVPCYSTSALIGNKSLYRCYTLAYSRNKNIRALGSNSFFLCVLLSSNQEVCNISDHADFHHSDSDLHHLVIDHIQEPFSDPFRIRRLKRITTHKFLNHSDLAVSVGGDQDDIFMDMMKPSNQPLRQEL